MSSSLFIIFPFIIQQFPWITQSISLGICLNNTLQKSHRVTNTFVQKRGHCFIGPEVLGNLIKLKILPDLKLYNSDTAVTVNLITKTQSIYLVLSA